MNGNHPADDRGFRAVLAYLRDSRGFDFSGYKPAGLKRRIMKRMRSLDEPVESFEGYMDYLEVHPDEFVRLFNTILINVTAFFRDRAAWDFIAREVVPQVIGSLDENETFRCWTAGCASGEETYSLAMLLAEALGQHEYRRRVKI